MHVVDERMVDEQRAHLGAAVDDAEIAARHERLERALEIRSDPLVHRIHLEDAHHALDEHLAGDVHRRDARHVAGAEDHGQPALGIVSLVERGLSFARLLGRDPGLHQHVPREAHEGDAVEAAGREERDLGATVGPRARAASQRRASRRGDRVEAVGEQAEETDRGRRTGEPFLRRLRVARRGARRDPAGCLGQQARDALPDQRGFLGRRRGARTRAPCSSPRRRRRR